MTQTTSAPDWRRAIFNRRMVVCIFTGFASGMPLYLLLNLVPAWLRNENVPLTVIGIFALAQFPFTWKFLWAPLLDRYNVVSWLGRRRGWMFVTQIGLVAAIAWLGQTGVSGQGFPWQAFMLATVIALLSATQDIALDAFRREILPEEELGLGNAIHVNAYRIAGLVPGSLSLILADRLPWGEVFVITAAFMLPGLVMTLLVKEPAVAKGAPRTLHAAVVEPFAEFFSRHGLKSALLALLFIFLYKLGDSLCTALATPFYLDMGFSNTDIGIVVKNAGLWASVIGGIFGGIWMIKLGINRALWLFGVVQAISILGFAGLAWVGPPFVAPQEHDGMPPDEFVRVVTGDVFANACTNRTILAGNERNARTLVDSSLRRYFNFNRMTSLATGLSQENDTNKLWKKLTDEQWKKFSTDEERKKFFIDEQWKKLTAEQQKKLTVEQWKKFADEQRKNLFTDEQWGNFTDGERKNFDDEQWEKLTDEQRKNLFTDEQWKKFSDEQQKKLTAEQWKKLTDTFHILLARDWAGSVFQHCDQTVEVNAPHVDPNARDVTVSAIMYRTGAQPIRVDYSLEKISNKKESPFSAFVSLFSSKAQNLREQTPKVQDSKEQAWKVFDITVDGQSLVKSYRETFTNKVHAVVISTDASKRDAAIDDGLIGWIKKQIETDIRALLALALVVGFEALGVGLGSAAFVAFMARTTHPAYVATQLALFTSLMAVPRTLINATAGWLVEGMGGWYSFFWFCFFLAIPGMLLLFKVAPWKGSPPSACAPSMGAL